MRSNLVFLGTGGLPSGECLLTKLLRNPCLNQATFLRGASPAEDPALVRELEALSADELDTRCRRNGLSRRCLLVLQHPTCPLASMGRQSGCCHEPGHWVPL